VLSPRDLIIVWNSIGLCSLSVLHPPEQLPQGDLLGLFAGRLAVAVQPGCNFAMESSCAIAGGSTKTLIRVAGLMLPNAKPLRPNSAIPMTAASSSEEAETVTVCVTSAPSVNETRQVLDTLITHLS
jgi:hypothetical protein